jgi:putative transposase
LQLKDVIAFDPNVEEFLYGRTGEGRVIELYDAQLLRRLKRLSSRASVLTQLSNRATEWAEDPEHGPQREANLELATKFYDEMLAVRAKMRNVRSQFHQAAVNYILANFRLILLPRFNVSEMVARRHPRTGMPRNIGPLSAKMLLDMAHYKFRQLLLNAAKLCPGVEVIVCDEVYTSKTCSACGELRHDLGGSKTFECRVCHMTMHRDANAATNILLRYVVLWCARYKSGHKSITSRPVTSRGNGDAASKLCGALTIRAGPS